ncbi:hypothetical protein LBMAG53_16550 [Planctomycetota bacterium]|nr:hypothetical protein LBMAG53_16550 [Planctomycetota bacterium]
MFLARPIVAIALALLVGIGPAAVQVVGWSMMLAERLSERPVAAAVASTFDGSTPCQLCRLASRLGDDPTQQPSAPEPGKNLVLKKASTDALPPVQVVPAIHASPIATVLSPEPDPLALRLAVAPELPPPRV